MKPVYQRTKTDCLTAAIATVTGLPYEECPQLWEFSGDEWCHQLIEWAQTKGLGVVYFDLKDRKSWPWMVGFDCILGGTTDRSTEYFHCVVAHAEMDNGTTKLFYIHDPLKNGNFIIGDPDHCIFFVPSCPGAAR